MTLPRSLTSLLLAGALLAPSAHASQPTAWQFADDADFRRGNLDGLALHPTLGLTAAPKLTRLDVDAEFIHCWLRDGQRLWLGTGLNGKLFKVENGAVTEVAKVDGPLIASLASDGKGGVYAGLVGTGEILHIDAAGKKETFVKLTDIQHIWAGPGSVRGHWAGRQGLCRRRRDEDREVVCRNDGGPRSGAAVGRRSAARGNV